MKTKNPKKRTEKKFENYSDYHDRPFGLKWGTPFAIDELNKVIVENKDKEQNSVEELPQMSREEIDKVLQYAFLKSKTISIQLNERNEMGHYKENIIGHFKGFADAKYLYVEDEAIEWINIRNIAVI